MKTRVRTGVNRSSPPPTPSFYTFLKPGALAQLRYSKMTARSKVIGAQTLLALCQLESSLESAFPQQLSTGLSMDRIPSFDSRVMGFPRCIQRKKLVGVAPYFSESQT